MAMPLVPDDVPSIWLRQSGRARRPSCFDQDLVDDAAARLERFAPVLAELFPDAEWDGRITSPLADFAGNNTACLVKADHILPMTGTVKARGGVYESLCEIERLALAEGIVRHGETLAPLMSPEARARLGRHRIIVASTGNLGFSIGLVARRFGLAAEVHMSRDAKDWKKQRLIDTGVTVVEHACDYEQTVARARAAAERDGGYFVDDERSVQLLIGYATAARELAGQLDARGIAITAGRPLVVYLPCGVGGAPGGVTAGLRAIYGEAFVAVFVEPIASACVFAAMAAGDGRAVSVYDHGLDNDTIADGLAVPRASELVLEMVGDDIDAVVALPDAMMLDWVRVAWLQSGLKLEPSAAAALAAIPAFAACIGERPGYRPDLNLDNAVHVAWTTGGSLMPEDVFRELLREAA